MANVTSVMQLPPNSGQPPVMYQPDPAGGHGLGYGQQPGRFGMAPSGAPPGGFGQQPMGFGMTPIGVPPGRFGQQPMGLGMTPIGVPPGLEYLTQIDQILIHQKVELLEAIIGFERNNKYDIKNTMGQKIYTANEETDCCTRNCIGSLRCFDMKIKDTMDREVIRLIRPLRCIGCCCPCCLQEMEVQSPPGTTIGFVKQDWHPCLPKFSIQGADGQTVMKLVGPCFTCSCCCGDVNFELRGKDGEESIGRISKQWSGLVKEFFTDAENFGIQFPMDLDVKMKAVLLGTCFLIDFMFFERN